MEKSAEIRMSDGIDIYRDTWPEVTQWCCNCQMSFALTRSKDTVQCLFIIFIFFFCCLVLSLWY